MLPLVSIRYYAVALLLGSGFLVIGGRLFYLGFHGEKYTHFAEASRLKLKTLPATRGKIIDCKGRCLATQQKVYDLGVDLTQIREDDRTHLPRLAHLLSKPLQQLEDLWHKSDCHWKPLYNDLSENLYKKVMQLKMRGVYGNEKAQRVYLHAQSLSYIIGFINQDNVPAFGIEKMMNFYLTGQNGYIHYEIDGKNKELVQHRKEQLPPIDGYTVELTIDQQIQSITEEVLKSAFEEYAPLSVHAIVTRPHTGEILALVNYPFFDSNHYNKYPIEALKNKAITDIYEPGSVFKAISVSAAIDCGVVVPTDKFDCSLKKAPYHDKELPLPNDWKHFSGNMTVSEILSHSSNRGTVQIAFKLGAERLYKYASLFGFGASTNSGLSGETKGMLHPIERWDGLTITRLPIGHSIACSLLQMHYAMGVIANGGVLFFPQLIRRIYNANGEIVRSFNPQMRRQVLKEETSKMMRHMLLLSEQSKAYIPFYNVTGKTGTTQKIINGHYSHTQHIASFSGFFPNRNPQIQITLTIDSPHVQGTGYGSLVAAPIFKKIAEQIIPYLGIEPESKPL